MPKEIAGGFCARPRDAHKRSVGTVTVVGGSHGGMGDLLSGVVAARWAYLGGDAFLPAAASAWIHGAAGDALVADGGDMSIVNMAARIGSMRIHLDAAGE